VGFRYPSISWDKAKARFSVAKHCQGIGVWGRVGLFFCVFWVVCVVVVFFVFGGGGGFVLGQVAEAEGEISVRSKKKMRGRVTGPLGCTIRSRRIRREQAKTDTVTGKSKGETASAERGEKSEAVYGLELHLGERKKRRSDTGKGERGGGVLGGPKGNVEKARNASREFLV